MSQPLSSYSSPLPRKILQVHCANLDIFSRESDVDSGGESPVGGHISRSMERNNIENFQLLNRGHMPPELMITTAQVYDMQIVTEGNTSFTKETKDTKDFYSEVCQTDSDYSWSPERSKSQVTSKITILRSDFSPEIRVGFHRSVSLQQRLWSRSDLEAGLLAWSSPILCTDTAILRSCSHKLSLLKEHRGKGKAKSTNREKKQEKAALSRNKYKQAIMRAEDAELIGEKAEYAEHLDVKYTKLKKKKIKKKGLGKQSLEIPQKALRKGDSASSSSNSGGVSKAEIMKIQNQMPEDDKATRSRKKKKQRFVNIHRKIRKVINAVTTSNGDRSVCSNEDYKPI
ncbi:uncharacterized protein [Bemisia tabaci]|uniref:uncharacterized protein isoform X2 n=2 Tax=Bemisia tabaci TaxID=7038 RepID=UPI003B28A0EA